MKEHYIKYNGTPVYVSDSMERLSEVIGRLEGLPTTKTLSLEEAPEHHKGNFRVRLVSELEGFI